MEKTGRSTPNAERPSAAPGRAGAVFAFLLLWAAGLCAVLDAHLAHAAREAFVDSGRALARHYAAAHGDALLAGDLLLLKAYARRLAGEPGGLWAASYDEAGRLIEASGPAPDSAVGVSSGVREDPAAGAMIFAEAVHAGGRARGLLRWSRGTETLDRARGARRLRLAGAWLWAACAAAAIFLLGRRRTP